MVILLLLRNFAATIIIRCFRLSIFHYFNLSILYVEISFLCVAFHRTGICFLADVEYITDAVYEDAFGPLQKGKTQYYVSSGLGIWGAKFRVGTRSEYVVDSLKNKE